MVPTGLLFVLLIGNVKLTGAQYSIVSLMSDPTEGFEPLKTV